MGALGLTYSLSSAMPGRLGKWSRRDLGRATWMGSSDFVSPLPTLPSLIHGPRGCFPAKARSGVEVALAPDRSPRVVVLTA